MVEKVALAAATDDSRPLRKTIYTQVKDDDLCLAATDGYLLAEHCAHIVGVGTWDYGMPIPVRHFLQGLQDMPEETTQVTLECFAVTKQLIQRNGYEVKDATPVVECLLAHLLTDRISLDLCLPVGTFPNYQHVVAQPTTMQALCETAALLAAVEELAPLANPADHALTFAIEENQIRIEVSTRTQEHENEDFGVRTCHVSAVSTGNEARVILDCRYILTILRVLSTPPDFVRADECLSTSGVATSWR